MRKGQTDRDREKHLEKIQTDKNRQKEIGGETNSMWNRDASFQMAKRDGNRQKQRQTEEETDRDGDRKKQRQTEEEIEAETDRGRRSLEVG